MSLKASTTCSIPLTMTYNSEYGQTFVLVVADGVVGSGTTIRFSSKCNVTKCHAGQYMDDVNGICMNCPEGSVSVAGSVSLSECISCRADGLEPLGAKSKDCKISLSADPALNTGNSWRVVIPKDHSVNKWAVDIDELEFYSADDCSAQSKISTAGGVAFSSGYAGPGWEPAKAFNAAWRWGGRLDFRDLFYLGITLNRTVSVNCIIYKQPSIMVNEIRVQAKGENENIWKNVWISRYLPNTTNVIPFVTVPTRAPTTMPTLTPTVEPSKAPTIAPQPLTSTPVLVPVSTNDDVCSKPENSCSTGLFRFFKSGQTMHRNFLGICTERCSAFSVFRGFISLFGWKCGPCP
jgi:hypothetical protein